MPYGGKAESFGAQAAAAARAAAAFYRGWRSGTPTENALQREQQRQVTRYAAAMQRYRTRMAGLKARLVMGGTVFLGGAAVAASSLDGMPGEAPLAVLGGGAAVIGGWQAVRARTELKHTPEPPRPLPIVAPAPALPNNSPGAMGAVRVATIRHHLMELLPQVEQIQPEAAEQVRILDAQTAPGMNALVERIRSMQRISQQMPGSSTSRTAASSMRALVQRLDEGADAYQELLDAVIGLISAPELAASPSQALRPAIVDLQSYAAGLQRAAETW